MTEKFNLDHLLEEIKTDETEDLSIKSVKMSQDEIQRLIDKRRKPEPASQK